MALIKKRTVAKALVMYALHKVDRRWLALMGASVVAAAVATTVATARLRARP